MGTYLIVGIGIFLVAGMIALAGQNFIREFIIEDDGICHHGVDREYCPKCN